LIVIILDSKWIEGNEPSLGSIKEYWMESKKKSIWEMKEEMKIVGILEWEIFPESTLFGIVRDL
jgi:hypothetical protein